MAGSLLKEHEQWAIDQLEGAAKDNLLDVVEDVTTKCPTRRGCVPENLPSILDIEKRRESYQDSHFCPRWSQGLYPAIYQDQSDWKGHVEEANRFWADREIATRVFQLQYDKSFIVELKVVHQIRLGNRYSRKDEKKLTRFHTIWVCDRQAKDVSGYTRSTRAAVKKSLLLSNL